MLVLVLFVTGFVAVISGDMVGMSYYFDETYLDVFSDRQCVNTTRWSLVSYEYLNVVPPCEGRSEAIRALRNSCTATFPISFVAGTLEITVYLRTISLYSGITVSVFDDRDEVLTSVKYQRSNKNFQPGWVDVTLPIKEHTIGYVQMSGKSLNSELVIVDSLQYIPGNLTYSQSDIKDEKVTSDLITNKPYTNMQELSSPDEFIFAFDAIDTDGNIGDIDGSGDPPVTEDNTEVPDIGTEDPGIGTEDPGIATEDPGIGTEDPGIGTEDPGIGTEDPGIATEDPGIVTEDPGIATEDPGIATEDPGIGTEDPGIGTEDPGIGTEDPGIGTEDPGIATEDPGIGTEDPGIATEDPGIATEDPGIVTEDPGIATEDPGIATEDPGIGTEDPGIGTEDPGIGTEDPGIGTEDPGIATEDPGIATEDPGIGTEDPGIGTEDPGIGTKDPGIDTGTEEPMEEDRENSEESGFWNAFTITFVSVGAFTAVGLVGVSAYYLGMSKGVSANLPPDIETQEAPSIIPRARSVFSEVPYDRQNSFSRYS